MPKPKLFKGNNSDSESELNINTDYANNYNNWRQKEEINKLKTKYGDHLRDVGNSEDDNSSTSEDEDEEGNELTEEFEKDFYKTLACLKNKDPRIYDENVNFFGNVEKPVEDGEEKKKKKKEKPLFLRDYERKVMTERGGKFSDSEDEELMGEESSGAMLTPTYVEEQRKLKESFKKVLDEDEHEEDGLLLPKKATEEEQRKEEEAYKEWLKGQKAEIDGQQQSELKPLRDFWTDPKLDPNEKFLRDYVLNKKFLDKETVEVDPEYDQMIHDSDDNLSEDERNIEKQEEFEHKYNFRFEEPDQDFIKRYPRTMESSLRRKDTRRSEKRAEVKKRKDDEKLKKREELKQLKAMKRKEIEEKIEKLKEITGNDDMQFNEVDLDGDFDPAEHDRKMQALFNEDYYAGSEGDMKPEFPDIDEELAVEKTWDKYDPQKDQFALEDEYNYGGPHCDDPDFNMDADYDASKTLQEELVESSRKKKRRRRNKLAEAIAKEKPKFDPAADPSYQAYLDQYYSLDYEDMIGDVPCRFKYRNVVANDYGLTLEEILMADDKELNKWCSLKKALQHRPEYLELNDVRAYTQKAQNEALKKKIFKSIYGPREETENQQQDVAESSQQNQEPSKKKRKRNKKRKQPAVNSNEDEEQPSNKKLKQDSIVNNVSVENDGDLKQERIVHAQTSQGPEIAEEGLEQVKDGQQQVAPKKRKNNKNKNTTQSDVKKDSGGESEIIIKPVISQVKQNINDKSLQNGGKMKSIGNKKKKNKNDTDTSGKIGVKGAFGAQTREPTVVKNPVNTKPKKKKMNTKHSAVTNTKNTDELKSNKTNINGEKQQRNQVDNNKKRKNNDKHKIKHNKVAKAQGQNQIADLSAERLKAYGINPKKFKNKLKYGNKN